MPNLDALTIKYVSGIPRFRLTLEGVLSGIRVLILVRMAQILDVGRVVLGATQGGGCLM